MKAYWQGMLSGDLLTMPVRLYAAVTSSEPRFHYTSCGMPHPSGVYAPLPALLSEQGTGNVGAV